MKAIHLINNEVRKIKIKAETGDMMIANIIKTYFSIFFLTLININKTIYPKNPTAKIIIGTNSQKKSR